MNKKIHLLLLTALLLTGCYNKEIEQIHQEVNSLSGGAHIATMELLLGNVPEGETSVTEWAEKSISSIEKQFESYHTIAQLDLKIEDINKALSEVGITVGSHADKITALEKSILAALFAVSGCYKEDIEQLNREINSLKEGEIASLKKQVENISSSLNTLNTLTDGLDSRTIYLTHNNGSYQIQLY